MGVGTSRTDLRGLTPDQTCSLIVEYFNSRGLTLDQAFSFIDTDRSGFISLREFTQGVNMCLDQVGPAWRLSNQDISNIFKRFDYNGDGKISLEEFSRSFSLHTGVDASSMWYREDRSRMGAGAVGIGAHRGLVGSPAYSTGTTYVAPETYDSKRVDWVIARIAGAVQRAGFTPAALFNKVDKDGNGRLSWTELQQVILRFQPDLSETERTMVFKRFDKDGTMDIDIREFCATLENCHGSSVVMVEEVVQKLGERFKLRGFDLTTALRAFDVEMKGSLTRAEFLRSMQTMAPDISPADVDNIFRMFDMNDDGFLSLHEFQLFFQDSIERSSSPHPLTVGAAPGTYGGGTYAGGTYAGGTYIDPRASLVPTPGLHRSDPYGYGTTAVYPSAVTYPLEEAWERQILDKCKSALSAGRSGLTISEVFRRLDIYNTGYMNITEFQRMVSAYCPDLSNAHIERLFRIVNYSGTGHITLSEFIRRFG